MCYWDFMGRKTPIFNTLSQIYSDISLFQARLEGGKHIPSNSVLQTLDDLKFARVLVDYLKKGSYLYLSKTNEESTLNLLSLYRSNLNRNQLLELSDLTPRQLYYASAKVEDALNTRFPTGLLNLWKNRSFKEIESYMYAETTEVSNLTEFLTSNYLVQYFPNLLDTTATKLFSSELVKETSKEKIVQSLKRVLEVEGEINTLLNNYRNDLCMWGSLIRYLTLNKTLPADLLIELRKQNFPNNSSVEFDRIEGIE